MPREDGKVIIHLNVAVKANDKVKAQWITVCSGARDEMENG